MSQGSSGAAVLLPSEMSLLIASSPCSALYVVDLKKFRKIAAGDRLRGQYQGLSQDPNSLSNLDQVCFIVFVLFYWAMVSGWDWGFSQGFGLEWDEMFIHHFIFALGRKKTLTQVHFHNTVDLGEGLLLLFCTLWKQLLTLTLRNRICQTI